jgi:hypothetical protein
LLLADSGSGRAERPARAAWAALRLPTAVADSFFVISGSGRAMMMMMTSASPSGGDGGVAGSGRLARAREGSEQG